MFVAVYGLHTIYDRVKLWEDLRGLITTVQEPILCMGDYNAVLQAENRVKGSPVQDIEIKDFNEFMIDAKMHKLKTVGAFTLGLKNTCSRINRL